MSTDKNRRVLIIDDNRSIHDDFRKILCPATAGEEALDAAETEVFGRPTETVRQGRFEVDSAYQGEEGALLVKKALAAGLPYAMAFIDVRMPPGWDGVETSRKIWEFDPCLQVVLCTAYSDYSWDEVFENLVHHDGFLILKKPFDGVEAFQMASALTEKWWLYQEAQRKMEELEGRVAERTGELQRSNHALQAEAAEHQSAAEMLRESKHFAESIAENSTSIIYLYDLATQATVYANRNAAEALGYTAAQILEMGANFLPRVAHPEDLPRILRQHAQFADVADSRIFDLEYRLKDASGDWHWMWSRETVFKRHPNGAAWEILGTAQDITERKRLEVRLLQAQKLETVGKLAGGVAHEFNSILTAIIGQSELLLADLPAGGPAAKSATEIGNAAGRAAILTRQLLAYGRKQILQPEILNLNSIVAGMESTLRHLVGRATEVSIAFAEPKSVKADAGQIEQVIMNMVLNAHEAMPNGGKLILETANVSFDQESVGRYPELKPGDYVMLAITDTGGGMRDEVRVRAFEPFFSTKGVGEGTGLGLSSCYGIVKQSGGHISVYSEPGRGTTFKIYLPQVEPVTRIPVERVNAPGLSRGTETILLVEDDPAMREMAATLLRRLGYTVLVAANGVEALSLKQQPNTGHIDLLFTDVVMPHMSGSELADRVRALYPHTRILFTSAYTENAIVHQGVLDKGVALLQKPFTPSALAHKLREMLDQPGARNSDTALVNTQRIS